MSDESFYGISQLPGLKTLNIGNVPYQQFSIASIGPIYQGAIAGGSVVPQGPEK